MASKLNVSPPRMREVSPPGALKSQRSGGRHESRWLSRITIERQITDPNPKAADVGNFRMDAKPGAVRRALSGRKP